MKPDQEASQNPDRCQGATDNPDTRKPAELLGLSGLSALTGQNIAKTFRRRGTRQCRPLLYRGTPLVETSHYTLTTLTTLTVIEKYRENSCQGSFTRTLGTLATLTQPPPAFPLGRGC